MEGYSVDEAATVLGIPVERVWELMARGVLTGVPGEDGGMRVHLGGAPPGGAVAPAATTSSPPTTVPDAGDQAPEAGYPDPEMSPFRELLTEFRHLTERYGQALLALGEARGEVAGLRNRVELLEARIDLRLPASSTLSVPADQPGPGDPEEASVSGRPGAAAGEAHGDGEQDGEVEAELSREMAQQETAAPAPAVAFDEQEPAASVSADDAGPAPEPMTEPSFAGGGLEEVWTVPEPPAVAGEPAVALGPLPGAADAGTDEPMTVPEGGYESAWDEPDWIAEEDLEPAVVADEPGLVAAPSDASEVDSEPEAEVDSEPEAEVDSEPEPEAEPEPEVEPEPEPEAEPESEAGAEPEEQVVAGPEPEVTVEGQVRAPGGEDGADVPEGTATEGSDDEPETEGSDEEPDTTVSGPAEMTLSPWGEAAPVDDADELLLHEPESLMPPPGTERETEDQHQVGMGATDEPSDRPQRAGERPTDAVMAASDAYEEELMWLGDEFRPSTSGWQGAAPESAVAPGSAHAGRDAGQLEEMARQRGWDTEELSAIRSLLGAHPDRAAEPLREPERPLVPDDSETADAGEEVAQAPSAAPTPTAPRSEQAGVTLPGADELSEAMAALRAGVPAPLAMGEAASTEPASTEPASREPASDETGAADAPATAGDAPATAGDAPSPPAPAPEAHGAGEAGEEATPDDTPGVDGPSDLADPGPAEDGAPATADAGTATQADEAAPATTHEPAQPKPDTPEPAWPTTDRSEREPALPDPRAIYRAGQQEAEARRGPYRRGAAASAYRRLRRLFPR